MLMFVALLTLFERARRTACKRPSRKVLLPLTQQPGFLCSVITSKTTRVCHHTDCFHPCCYPIFVLNRCVVDIDSWKQSDFAFADTFNHRIFPCQRRFRHHDSITFVESEFFGILANVVMRCNHAMNFSHDGNFQGCRVAVVVVVSLCLMERGFWAARTSICTLFW